MIQGERMGAFSESMGDKGMGKKGEGKTLCYSPRWVCGREGQIAKHCHGRKSRNPSPNGGTRGDKGAKNESKGGK